eukprot:689171_1
MAAVVEQKQKEAIARPIKVFGQDQERWMKFIPDESILIASAHGDWACIGIDHPIDPLRTTSFEIMPIAVSPSNLHKQHFAVGLASKGVINSVGYDYMGKYVESWCYYCNGNIMTGYKVHRDHGTDCIASSISNGTQTVYNEYVHTGG